MAELRPGFWMHRLRARAQRILLSRHDIAMFSLLLCLFALFLLWVPIARPGSLTWAWAIVTLSSCYCQIPIVFTGSVRLTIPQKMVVTLLTVVVWKTFRFLFDREESVTVALSYLLLSPELSGYTVRALQIAVGSSLFIISAALTRPPPPPYRPISQEERSTRPIPSPSEKDQHSTTPIRLPPLVFVERNLFGPKPTPVPCAKPPSPKLVLCGEYRQTEEYEDHWPQYSPHYNWPVPSSQSLPRKLLLGGEYRHSYRHTEYDHWSQYCLYYVEPTQLHRRKDAINIPEEPPRRQFTGPSFQLRPPKYTTPPRFGRPPLTDRELFILCAVTAVIFVSILFRWRLYPSWTMVLYLARFIWGCITVSTYVMIAVIVGVFAWSKLPSREYLSSFSVKKIPRILFMAVLDQFGEERMRHDLGFFCAILAFVALFVVLLPDARPMSVRWAWIIVAFSSLFSEISLVFTSLPRASFSEKMRIGVFTTISWIFCTLILDWKESLMAAFCFLLTSPKLSGLVLLYAALDGPARSLFYEPCREESSTHILPPVHEERVCEPPLMPIRPMIFPTTSPCLSRPTLPSPRVVLRRAEIWPRPLSVQPPYLPRRPPRAVSPFLSQRL